MEYNKYKPNNAIKIERAEAGTIIDGIIFNIVEGTPRDFIESEQQLSKFKNKDETCINVFIEFKYNDKVFKINQLFSFIEGKDCIYYTDNSNLGRYKKFYKKLPEVSDKVKLMSNSEGFFRLVI